MKAGKPSVGTRSVERTQDKVKEEGRAVEKFIPEA
jgi:hypothetical protein